MTDALHPLIQAQIDGTTIAYIDLVRFDFRSGERRLHNGFGPIPDGNGEVWDGLAGMGQVGAVSAGPGLAIEEMTFTLAADAAILAHIEADAAESIGREVFRYLQFLDVRDKNEAGLSVQYTPIGSPFQVFWGKMGPLRPVRQKVDRGSPNAMQRSVSVSAVNAFINRRKPALGFFSHRDQLARTGGTDNIFINASRMANATAVWPYGLS